jgi:hypothetical protein
MHYRWQFLIQTEQRIQRLYGFENDFRLKPSISLSPFILQRQRMSMGML